MAMTFDFKGFLMWKAVILLQTLAAISFVFSGNFAVAGMFVGVAAISVVIHRKAPRN
jgi:hypothetical protein